MTNFEKIKAMNPEEMADFLCIQAKCKSETYDGDYNNECLIIDFCRSKENLYLFCYNVWLKWLKSESD